MQLVVAGYLTTKHDFENLGGRLPGCSPLGCRPDNNAQNFAPKIMCWGNSLSDCSGYKWL